MELEDLGGHGRVGQYWEGLRGSLGGQTGCLVSNPHRPARSVYKIENEKARSSSNGL